MKNTLKTLYCIFIPYKRGIRATIGLHYALLSSLVRQKNNNSDLSIYLTLLTSFFLLSNAIP